MDHLIDMAVGPNSPDDVAEIIIRIHKDEYEELVQDYTNLVSFLREYDRRLQSGMCGGEVRPEPESIILVSNLLWESKHYFEKKERSEDATIPS